MKALALVESPGHVCCRYRLQAFEPALDAAGWTLHYEGVARGLRERLIQLRRAAQFDAVILQRRLLPRTLMHWLRRHSRRLIFDFDDAVLYRDSYQSRGFHDPRRLVRFATAMRLADRVLAGNDFLRDCALAAGASADRVQVFPTCVDTEAYPTRPDRPIGRTRTLDLVWIGSSSTLQGLEQQADLWRRIGREVPGLRLRMICDRFAEFDPLPVVAVPWSAATEVAELQASDLGVSWIPDDPWSRGKCGLKVLQYQAAGLPTLANPVGVHTAMIQPGVTGALCSSPDEWVSALRHYSENPGACRAAGQAARRAIVANYSVSRWGPAFVEALGGRPIASHTGADHDSSVPLNDRALQPSHTTRSFSTGAHR